MPGVGGMALPALVRSPLFSFHCSRNSLTAKDLPLQQGINLIHPSDPLDRTGGLHTSYPLAGDTEATSVPPQDLLLLE